MRHLWYFTYGVAMVLLAAVILVYSTEPANAQSRGSEIDTLRRELQDLRRRDEENRRRIDELQRKIETLQAAPAPAEKPSTPEAALEKAIQEVAPTPAAPTKPDIVSGQLGGARFRLLDISADILFAVGSSTETDESLQILQGGDHDPRKRGFTLQAVELSLGGAVDPYFNAETHVTLNIDPLSGETTVELEEAFLTTQSLPYGLQLKAGHFFTEFGINNATHAHAWQWLTSRSSSPGSLVAMARGRQEPDCHGSRRCPGILSSSSGPKMPTARPCRASWPMTRFSRIVPSAGGRSQTAQLRA
ncbi:MAG: hypothetical protein ACRERE_11655 [Candidatus Entotheonellia bacterium]